MLSLADMMVLMPIAGRNNEIASENPSEPQIQTGEQSGNGMWYAPSGQPRVGLDVDTSAQPARRIQSAKTYNPSTLLQELDVRTDLDGLASSAFAEPNLHLGIHTDFGGPRLLGLPEAGLAQGRGVGHAHCYCDLDQERRYAGPETVDGIWWRMNGCKLPPLVCCQEI